MTNDLLPIIIFAAIAAFLFLRLRSVLGKRTEDDDERAEDRARQRFQRMDGDYQAGNGAADPQRPDNVISLPGAQADTAGGSGGIAAGVRAIQQIDPGFSKGDFLEGAKSAFAMIVTAFAGGDTATLRPLLSDELYDEFADAIRDRLGRGETLETRIDDIPHAEVVAAGVDGRTAQVTVKLVSVQVNVTRDENDAVIDGDPEEAIEVVDLWTFERNTRAADPNWTLTATATED